MIHIKCGECSKWNPKLFSTEEECQQHINHQKDLWNKVLGACEDDDSHYPMFDYEQCPLNK